MFCFAPSKNFSFMVFFFFFFFQALFSWPFVVARLRRNWLTLVLSQFGSHDLRVNECRYLCPAQQTNNLIRPQAHLSELICPPFNPPPPSSRLLRPRLGWAKRWRRGKWGAFACRWNVFLRFIRAFHLMVMTLVQMEMEGNLVLWWI